MTRRTMLLYLVPVALAAAYLVWKTINPASGTVDFKYLWFAGTLWAEGVNPYSPIYAARALEHFQGTNVPTWMVYPPSWYPLARGMAMMPHDIADQVWRLFNALFIVAAGVIVALTMRRVRRNDAVWPFVMLAVMLGMGVPTALSLSLGQTAPLLLLGVALYIRGLILGHRGCLAVALVILMLKPNLGLPFAMFAVAWRVFWPAVIGAGIVSVLAALPALLPLGLVTVVRSYVETLGDYGSVAVNAPPNLTGVINLMFYGPGILGINVVAILVVTAMAWAMAMWLGRRDRDRNRARRAGGHVGPGSDERVAAVMFLVALSAFCVPLHTYDLIVVLPLVLIACAERRPFTVVSIATLASLLVIFRVRNLANVSGFTMPSETVFAGSMLASLALLMLVCTTAAHFYMTAVAPRQAAAEMR
ncbi:MAG: glycosyltransferase 87 family protein [Pseudomonadota bacterium]